MSQDTDYYSILGVEPKATPDKIRAAFAALLGKFPRNIDPARDPQYQRILQAYKVLSNPERRATYDSLIQETMPYALQLEVQASRQHLDLVDSDQLVYMLVNVRAPEQTAATQQPLNLCLVIDRSTSMRGVRLERVKAAVHLILQKLTANDVLSVVSFSDRAEVVLPARLVENSHALNAQVRSIEASGGTEIYQGLIAGVQEMRKVSLADHTNHLILMTDGHTYGDVKECLHLAQQAAEQGITFSGMGIGTEWNDQFLDKLVAPSGGQTAFIESPEAIIEHLQNQIKGIGEVHARNLRLVLRLPQSVSLQYGFKLRPYAQPLTLDGNQINLGDIEGKAPLSFLLELSVAPQRIETRIKMPLRLLADIPSRQVRDRAFSHQFQLLALSNAPRAEPSTALVKAVRMLNMYRMNEKVWDDVEAGHLESATNRMRHLSTRLLEIGQSKLAHQAHSETQRLSKLGTLSPEGRKRLKYGTRALLNESVDIWGSDD